MTTLTAAEQASLISLLQDEDFNLDAIMDELSDDEFEFLSGVLAERDAQIQQEINSEIDALNAHAAWQLEHDREMAAREADYRAFRNQ